MISLLLKSIASSHSVLGKQGIMKGNSQVLQGLVHNSMQFWMQITAVWMLLLDQANAKAEKEASLVLPHFTSCSSIYAVRAFQHICLIYTFMEVGSTQYMGWVRLCLSSMSVPKISFVYWAAQWTRIKHEKLNEALKSCHLVSVCIMKQLHCGIKERTVLLTREQE